MLPGTISGQGLKFVSRWKTQGVEAFHRVQKNKFGMGTRSKIRRNARAFVQPKRLGILVRKGSYHCLHSHTDFRKTKVQNLESPLLGRRSVPLCPSLGSNLMTTRYREPLQKVIHARPVFQIFKQGGYRHAGATKHPFAADLAGVALNSLTLGERFHAAICPSSPLCEVTSTIPQSGSNLSVDFACVFLFGWCFVGLEE